MAYEWQESGSWSCKKRITLRGGLSSNMVFLVTQTRILEPRYSLAFGAKAFAVSNELVRERRWFCMEKGKRRFLIIAETRYS